MGELEGIPTQVLTLLNQIGFKPLIGQIEGCGQTGQTPADHQGLLDHIKGYFIQRFQKMGPGHGHPDQVFGFFRGQGRIILMNPGTLIANIGHLEEIFI